MAKANKAAANKVIVETKSTNKKEVVTMPKKTTEKTAVAPFVSEAERRLAERKAEREKERKAAEEFLNRNSEVSADKIVKKIDERINNKKEVANMETAKPAVKKTPAAQTKKEAPKPVTKKAEAKKPATTTKTKEAVMKKGKKAAGKGSREQNNFVRGETTVRDRLATYTSKVELDQHTDRVYLIDHDSATVLRRKMTTDTHNLTVFVRHDAGKNANALSSFVVRPSKKDKENIDQFRKINKNRPCVVEVLNDRPYIFQAKDVHVCVRYIKLS